MYRIVLYLRAVNCKLYGFHLHRLLDRLLKLCQQIVYHCDTLHQIRLARFHARDLQRFVHDHKQLFTRHADFVQIRVNLVVIRQMFFGKLCISDNRINWRADIM